jgi:predicted small integral membrane protein
VPTSVLLAVLAAAGLLALAPALTRGYDATERLAAERATSTARVLSRRRRRRTVPGPRPINPPRFTGVLRGGAAAPAGERGVGHAEPVRSGASRGRPAAARKGVSLRLAQPARPGRRLAAGRRHGRRGVTTALHRRRRVFLALVLLNLVELAGVVLVGPGFWIGFSVSFVVLLADLVYLRRRAVLVRRARRARAGRAAWVAAQQAAVRHEHSRREADRQSAARRAALEREEARRDAARRDTRRTDRYAPRPAAGTDFVPGPRAGQRRRD